MTACRLLPVLCLLAAAARAVPTDGTVDTPPVPLRLVPEMEPIAEADTWTRCEKDAAGEHAAHARADWKKKAAAVEKRVTPKVVRSLSRWAKKQMEKYQKVPPLKDAAWTPIRRHNRDGTLVFEATLDTLPSHSPIVTRWLKGYLLYDPARKSITRVIITIRGQLLE